jgi:transmembrane sensor
MKSTYDKTQTRHEGGTNLKTPFDTDKAWVRLHDRFLKDGLLQEDDASSPTTIRLYRPWMGWAATLLVLLTTGILIYLTTIRPDHTGLYTLITNQEDNTLIKVLDDGTVVYLAERASLHIPEQFSATHRSVTLSGEAFFDIEPNRDHPFSIHTESAIVAVLGTAFNIRSHSEEEFELFVEHGMVRVDLKKHEKQSMHAGVGDMVRFDDGKLVKHKGTNLEASAWKINRMHFKDETLENVLSVINRNYDSNLLIDREDLKSRRITVTFYNNTLPTIIELLCLSMNLDAEERRDESIVLKPKT